MQSLTTCVTDNLGDKRPPLQTNLEAGCRMDRSTWCPTWPPQLGIVSLAPTVVRRTLHRGVTVWFLCIEEVWRMPRDFIPGSVTEGILPVRPAWLYIGESTIRYLFKLDDILPVWPAGLYTGDRHFDFFKLGRHLPGWRTKTEMFWFGFGLNFYWYR